MALAFPATRAAADPPCTEALLIEGPLDATRAVRAGLAPDVPACPDAHASVEPIATGYRIALARGSRRVTREVATLAAATMWMETWLTPSEAEAIAETAPPEPSPERVTQTTAVGTAEAAWGQSRAPALPRTEPSGTRIQVGAVARIGVDEDGAPWLGPEIDLSITVSGPLWVGGGLSASWAIAEQGQDSWRRTFRAAVRVGLTTAPGPIVFRGGLGIGIYAGSYTIRHETVEIDDHGGPYVDGLAELAFALYGPLYATVGVDLELSAVQTRVEPDETLLAELPVFVASGRLGLALAFGGGS